jgi:hypothetical protein
MLVARRRLTHAAVGMVYGQALMRGAGSRSGTLVADFEAGHSEATYALDEHAPGTSAKGVARPSCHGGDGGGVYTEERRG